MDTLTVHFFNVSSMEEPESGFRTIGMLKAVNDAHPLERINHLCTIDKTIGLLVLRHLRIVLFIHPHLSGGNFP